MEGSIEKVWFERGMIFIRLVDGREAGLPIEWFPNLSSGSAEQMQNFQLLRNGQHIHWPELDEDLSMKGFFTYEPYLLPKGAAVKNAA